MNARASLARLRRLATRSAAPIVLAGGLSGLVTYILVSGARPLYETEAVIFAPAPALLEQYDRLISGAPARNRRDAAVELSDLGNVDEMASRAIARHGSTAAGSDIELRPDPSTGEVAVVVRGPSRRTSRQLANEIASDIVSTRDAATAAQSASARAELRLIGAFADDEPRLRPREDALRRRAAALDGLRRAPGGGLTVLRRARTPTQPVGPRVARDVVLAIVVGILAALTLRSLWRAAPPRVRRVGALRA